MSSSALVYRIKFEHVKTDRTRKLIHLNGFDYNRVLLEYPYCYCRSQGKVMFSDASNKSFCSRVEADPPGRSMSSSFYLQVGEGVKTIHLVMNKGAVQGWRRRVNEMNMK